MTDRTHEYTVNGKCEVHYHQPGQRIAINGGSSRGNFRGTFCTDCIESMTRRGFTVKIEKVAR
jgi:hypothetical protein